MADAKSDVRELLGAEPRHRLPEGTSVLDVAVDCRRVALAFAVFGDRAPTKLALAAWLAGPYRSLVLLAQPEDVVRASATRLRPVRVDEVDEGCAYARAYVLGIIRGMSRATRDVSFTYAAMHDGWIERCCDATGRPGWLPVDRPKMRLTERVLSLIAVDYLVRPTAWLDGRISSIAV